MNQKPTAGYRFLYVLFFFILSTTSRAQFSVDAQLRTRSEYRDGQGAPLPEGAPPAFFTSQRTRLGLGYSTYRLKFGLTVQDVRVWGQDVSTINRSTTQDNNGLMLYEAWAEIGITDSSYKKGNLTLKIGRQEIVFDDQRLIGNLDWLQQGRHHDAAILKYTTPAWNIQLGAAFNQNKELSSGTVYNATPPGNYTANTNGGPMYKSFEFGYANRHLNHGQVSFLAFADQFNQYNIDSTNAKTWGKGVWTRFTTGFYFTNRFNRTQVIAAAYYQTGRTSTNQSLSAGLLSVSAQYHFSAHFALGPGIDYTSGGSSGNISHAFDPLYGTPHKFWGLMDYFYAASGFGSKGLEDYYIKSEYGISKRLKLNVDLHQFFSASAVTNTNGYTNRDFGTEADLVADYALTNVIGFQAGYSRFWSTATLTSPQVKNVPDAKSNSNWAYLMITIRPSFMVK